MALLYLPHLWFSPALHKGDGHFVNNRPYTSGLRYRASRDTSLAERREIPKRYLGRFEPREVKKRERAYDPATGKVTTVVTLITVAPYILPSDIRKHPLNRHIFDENGDLRPEEEWGAPPTGRADPEKKLAFTAQAQPDSVPMSPVDMGAQRVAELRQEAEQPDPAIEAALNEAVEQAEKPRADYDPHEVPPKRSPYRKRS